MQKTRKKLVGLVCLALVALMTIVAYFLPTPASAVSDSHTDIIRVTVYDQYPGVKITSPDTDTVSVSDNLEIKFTYENANHVDFILSYVKLDDDGEVVLDEDGNPVYVKIDLLPRFDPEELDPTFFYDSGDGTVTFKLGDFLATYSEMYDIDDYAYGNFIITAKAVSPIGYAEDSIEFNYSPTTVVQTGGDSEGEDPVITVNYDDGVAKIVLVVKDGRGNAILDEPIEIILTPDEAGEYAAGSKVLTLPLGSYGLPTGTYTIEVTSYSSVATDTGEVDEDGEPIYEYDFVEIPYQYNPFYVSYIAPTPVVPDTGRFLGNLNIAESDYVITGVVVFAGVVFVAFALLSRKKKDYRKNLRNRK